MSQPKSLRNLVNKYRQPLTFLVCGGISALVELASFLALKGLFDSIYWPSLISFSLGLVASFLLNKYVVFGSRAGRKKFASEVAMFIVLGIINSQISAWLTTGLVSLMGREVVAKIITMAFVATWNYLVMSRLIFRNK